MAGGVRDAVIEIENASGLLFQRKCIRCQKWLDKRVACTRGRKGSAKRDGGTETTNWRGWMARVTLKNAVHGERRDLAYWSNNFPANLVKFSFAKCRCQIPGSPSDFWPFNRLPFARGNLPALFFRVFFFFFSTVIRWSVGWRCRTVRI